MRVAVASHPHLTLMSQALSASAADVAVDLCLHSLSRALVRDLDAARSEHFHRGGFSSGSRSERPLEGRDESRAIEPRNIFAQGPLVDCVGR